MNKRVACFILTVAAVFLSIVLYLLYQFSPQQKIAKSNILGDFEKRKGAEEFILGTESELLQRSYSSATTPLLYYDATTLNAKVDDDLTNLYIERQLIYDIDEEKDQTVEKELYLNHFYSVLFEYTAAYDPKQFTIVDGEEGILRIKIEFRVCEIDGVWEIIDTQYRGCTPLST